ncbi:MAG TPA: translesion error-prone DNA polymerase V autoproteolytic subunit [Burkholderiales bacterium]|nr:translesion error-prone DNA polymerase V autoproteolytic subunit [Burkholderiales bacterium]
MNDETKSRRGGYRPGAGRKTGTGAYKEPTKPIRVPESQVAVILDYLSAYRKKNDISAAALPVVTEAPRRTIPVMSHRVPAGFPSPADDYVQDRVDLNEHLILHRDASFILRVSGWSMVGAGIHDGDELIVDRAIEPVDGHVVVAVIDGELTVKRLRKSGKAVRLVAENPEYPDIEFLEGEELVIWGVVTRVLHKV